MGEYFITYCIKRDAKRNRYLKALHGNSRRFLVAFFAEIDSSLAIAVVVFFFFISAR